MQDLSIIAQGVDRAEELMSGLIGSCHVAELLRPCFIPFGAVGNLYQRLTLLGSPEEEGHICGISVEGRIYQSPL